MYKKLKRVWSHNDANYIPQFREIFPELNKVSSEEMRNRWVELGIDFYTEEIMPVKKLMRLTLPFALIFMLLMLIGLPLVFMITGKWEYSISDKNIILNWFRSLKLI